MSKTIKITTTAELESFLEEAKKIFEESQANQGGITDEELELIAAKFNEKTIQDAARLPDPSRAYRPTLDAAI